MSTNARRVIHFDLKVAALKKHYPGYYLKGYSDIKKYLENLGFHHIQYSGYVSSEKYTNYTLSTLVHNMCKELSWLKDCVSKMHVSTVVEIFDLTQAVKTGFKEFRWHLVEPEQKTSKFSLDNLKEKKKHSDKTKKIVDTHKKEKSL